MSDLTVSALSLRGTRFGEPARFTLAERARAAYQHGISSVGAELTDEITPEVRDYADVSELEWVNVDQPVDADVMRTLTAQLTRSQANRVNVGVCSRTRIPLEIVTARVAKLAEEIAPVTVAVEPVAFGWLHRVRDVMAVVNDARRPNARLLLDMWQMSMDSSDWADEYIDPDLIGEIQVCGVPPAWPGPDYEKLFTASQDRPYVADSAADVAWWLALLRRDGYDGPVSFELPHAANYTLPLETIAANVSGEMHTVLDAAEEFGRQLTIALGKAS